MSREIIASVIIVGYNGEQYLHRCLSSILDQDMPRGRYEVLFVDNGSTDRSVELVRERFATVKVVVLGHNLGYHMACNRGAQVARGRYLVVVPQDTVAHRRWLPELVRAAQQNDEALICTANSIGPGTPDHETQVRIGSVSQVHYRELSRLGHVTFRTSPALRHEFWTLACSGISGLFKRDVIAETGWLFEPLVGHYAGDVEAGFRVSVLGYKVLCVPGAVIYHVGEGAKSVANLSLLWRYALGSRDILLAYFKNMTQLEFLLALPLLSLGRSAKCLELRVKLVQRLTLFLISLVLTPALLAMVLVRLPSFVPARRAMISRRRVGHLWLLKNILSAGNRSPALEVDHRVARQE